MLSRSISRTEAADGEGGAADAGQQLPALTGTEGLAVTHPAHRDGEGGKGDGRGHHWTCQGTTADFVHTDEQRAAGPGDFLAGEGGRRASGRHG
jgi:hypothetical protein